MIIIIVLRSLNRTEELNYYCKILTHKIRKCMLKILLSRTITYYRYLQGFNKISKWNKQAVFVYCQMVRNYNHTVVRVHITGFSA